MMCQDRLIDSNKLTTLLGVADDTGGCACVGAGGTRELSILSAQFCCESETALKNEAYLLKKF